MANNYFSEFVKKTSPKPITLNPLGLNNKILTPNSCQRSNWMMSDMLCGRKLSDVTIITGGNFNLQTALSTGCCSSSCNSDNKLDTKDIILAGALNNPQLLSTGADILGKIGSGIMSMFGLGSDDKDSKNGENTIKIDGKDVKIGQKGIFNVGNGQVVQGTLNKDGSVTADDGKSYKPTGYAGTMVTAEAKTNNKTARSDASANNETITTTKGQLQESLSKAVDKKDSTKVEKETESRVAERTDNKTGGAKGTDSVNSDEKIKNADSAVDKYKDAVKAKDSKAIDSAKKEAQTALGEINSQISNLEGQLSKVEADINKAEADITKNSQEAQQNKNQLDDAKKDRDDASNAVKTTKDNIDNKNSEITSTTQKLTAEVNSKQNAYNQAASAYRTAQKAPNETDAQFAARKAELQRKMNEARGALEEAKENKEKTLKKLNTQLETLKTKLEKQEKTLKTKEADVQKLEGTATKLDEVKQALMARKEEIQAQLEEYKNKKIELERAAAENGEKFEAAQQSEQQKEGA